ncbi:5'-deoxynucleotidase [Paenibacillus planticolens]|uniref:5'-deoxynucleotidase n=1 Tax=Paenibacillus planticolens TaxID=2654976 RepID=A0ABX1ZMC3_9BACL|nr:5'-deoxynucleotidase [Paenibacillus planticolens]NOV01239.1 5'-deoxynucleotidase [Paenibacillus planticolens]
MNHHFFAYLYRLKYIDRWSLMWNMRRDTVAEHSFYVSTIAHMLCTIANEVYGRDVPTDRVVSIALFHDASEVLTGDIPQPVKHNNEQILRNFREIEDVAVERLIETIPPEISGIYRKLIQDPDPELYRWVKAADLLEAYIKCLTELSTGNREFVVAKQQILESLKKMNMPEVEYFLEHMSSSFEKTLDEITLHPNESK